MMHSIMKQIAIKNGYAQPIFAGCIGLWNFQNRLGQGPKDDVATLFKYFSYQPQIKGMMHSMVKQIAI